MNCISCTLCCEQKFESKELYIDHLKEIAKKLKCPNCPIRFDNVMVMIKHLEKCNGPLDPPFTSVNDMEQGPSESLSVDFKAEDGPERECSEEFLDKEPQDEQAETILEESEYVDANGHLYRRRVVRMRDIWSDEDTKKLIEGEGLSSSDESDEECHVTPIFLSSTKCPLCSRRVRGSESLRSHLTSAHSRLVRACPQCAKLFRNSDLRKHIDRKHNTPYSCVYCAKPFNKLAKARKHAASHTKARKHTCEVCQEVCCNYLDLKHHYKQAHRDLLHPKDVPQPISSYKCNSMWYEYKGHTYRHIKVKKDSGTQVLSCWVNECWVTCRVPIIGEVLVVGEHNHPPYPWVSERNELYTSLRHRTMTELSSLRIIYEEEAQKFPIGAQHLPFPETSMRTWRKNAMETSEQPTKKVNQASTMGDPQMDTSGYDREHYVMMY